METQKITLKFLFSCLFFFLEGHFNIINNKFFGAGMQEDGWKQFKIKHIFTQSFFAETANLHWSAFFFCFAILRNVVFVRIGNEIVKTKEYKKHVCWKVWFLFFFLARKCLLSINFFGQVVIPTIKSHVFWCVFYLFAEANLWLNQIVCKTDVFLGANLLFFLRSVCPFFCSLCPHSYTLSKLIILSMFLGPIWNYLMHTIVLRICVGVVFFVTWK